MQVSLKFNCWHYCDRIKMDDKLRVFLWGSGKQYERIITATTQKGKLDFSDGAFL